MVRLGGHLGPIIPTAWATVLFDAILELSGQSCVNLGLSWTIGGQAVGSKMTISLGRCIENDKMMMSMSSCPFTFSLFPSLVDLAWLFSAVLEI